MRYIVIATMLVSISTARADSFCDWRTLNNQCRDGSYNDDSTRKACKARDTLTLELIAKGCTVTVYGVWHCHKN